MPHVDPLEDEIRRLIVERLELPLDPVELRPEADLRDAVGLDSAALLEIVVGLEERFAFDVDPDQLQAEDVSSIAGLARYVRRCTGRTEEEVEC